MDPHTSLSQGWNMWIWMGKTAVRRTHDAAELETSFALGQRESDFLWIAK